MLHDILIIYKYIIIIISICDGLIFPSKREKQPGNFLKHAKMLLFGRMFGDKGHCELTEELSGMEAAFIYVYLCAYSLMALLRKAILSSALIKK